MKTKYNRDTGDDYQNTALAVNVIVNKLPKGKCFTFIIRPKKTDSASPSTKRKASSTLP